VVSTPPAAVLYRAATVVTSVSQRHSRPRHVRDPCHSPGSRFGAGGVAVDTRGSTTSVRVMEMGHVTQQHERPAVADGLARGRAVAVTAARSAIAKRAMAATLGRALATHAPDARVCVIDLDGTSHDVARRMPVDGPALGDVVALAASAPPHALADVIGREPTSGCYVVAADQHLSLPDAASAIATITALQRAFDCVVVDAPVALGNASRNLDHLAAIVDVIVVASTPHGDDLAATVRYVNTMSRRRIVGTLPPFLDIDVVVTGRAEELSAQREVMDRKLEHMPVAAVLPPLWGRAGAAHDDDALQPVVDRLLRDAHDDEHARRVPS
jgi:MinD-like ATPase involved in chromosome partitioning or flagellar assembly